MDLTFDFLVLLLENASKNGKVAVGWQLSLEGLRQLSEQRSPDPRDGYVDGQPLTLLGLTYNLGATRSGTLIELIVQSK